MTPSPTTPGGALTPDQAAQLIAGEVNAACIADGAEPVYEHRPEVYAKLTAILRRLHPTPPAEARVEAERIADEWFHAVPRLPLQTLRDAIASALSNRSAGDEGLMRECRENIAQRLIGTDVDALVRRLDARLAERTDRSKT